MAAGDFDLRDLMLEAQAEVQEIMREVMQEIALPAMTEMVRMQWAEMPEAMKEKFKAEQPEEYAALMRMLQ